MDVGRGFGLLSPCTCKYRHLHPEKDSLLCTVPPTFRFPMTPREALCLLGQVAAPMQVLWIQAHFLAALQKHFWGGTHLDPIQITNVYQQELRELHSPDGSHPACSNLVPSRSSMMRTQPCTRSSSMLLLRCRTLSRLRNILTHRMGTICGDHTSRSRITSTCSSDLIESTRSCIAPADKSSRLTRPFL